MVEVGGRMRSIVLLVLRRSQQYLPPSAFPFSILPFALPPSVILASLPTTVFHTCTRPQHCMHCVVSFALLAVLFGNLAPLALPQAPASLALPQAPVGQVSGGSRGPLHKSLRWGSFARDKLSVSPTPWRS